MFLEYIGQISLLLYCLIVITRSFPIRTLFIFVKRFSSLNIVSFLIPSEFLLRIFVTVGKQQLKLHLGGSVAKCLCGVICAQLYEMSNRRAWWELWQLVQILLIYIYVYILKLITILSQNKHNAYRNLLIMCTFHLLFICDIMYL